MKVKEGLPDLCSLCVHSSFHPVASCRYCCFDPRVTIHQFSKALSKDLSCATGQEMTEVTLNSDTFSEISAATRVPSSLGLCGIRQNLGAAMKRRLFPKIADRVGCSMLKDRIPSNEKTLLATSHLHGKYFTAGN